MGKRKATIWCHGPGTARYRAATLDGLPIKSHAPEKLGGKELTA
jgi:hypothetical protein